jgi:selenocysteine lyase/cysteine desulfurase
MSPLDIEKLRAETPGCKNVLHLNNAGSALPTARTLQAVQDHLTLEAEIGGYEAHDRNAKAIDAFYGATAKLLNCRADEVAFVENATRAWDMAFYSLKFSPGDRILTSVAEYASNFIAFLQIAQRSGVSVEVVPDDPHGQIDVAALARMIDTKTKLIAITHVPSQSGLVQPATAVGKIAQAAGVPFLLDACQSAGQIELDVAALGCDMLSGTGRKYLRGPRGTGFLYVRKALLDRLEPPFLDLHAAEWTGPKTFKMRDDARRFENWECFYAGKLGLAVAIEQYLQLGPAAVQKRIYALANDFRRRLNQMPGVTVQDRGVEHCGIVSFTKDGVAPLAIRDALRAQAINTSVAPATYARLDLEPRGLESVVRASVHYYNTEQELERFCAALNRLG